MESNGQIEKAQYNNGMSGWSFGLKMLHEHMYGSVPISVV
jgi:hypothetical protein